MAIIVKYSKTKGIVIKKYIFLISTLLFTSCATKQAIVSHSSTILLKTPKMKFYDRGFITKYKEFTQVQIFNAGALILNLKLYEDKVCSDTFSCLDNKSFNKQYLNSSYENKFLKNLFDKEDKKIIFKDRNNGILIKVIKN